MDTRYLEWFFLVTLGLVRLGMGIYSTVPTASLLDLAVKHDVEYDYMAQIFSWRGVGSFAGSVLIAFYMQWKPFVNVIDTVTVYGLCTVLAGVFNLAIPLMKSVTMVSVLITATATLTGCIDIGLQAAIIEAWGVKSPAYVQFYHGAWSFGSLLGPYIVQPFVLVDSNSDVCGNSNSSHNLPCAKKLSFFLKIG